MLNVFLPLAFRIPPVNPAVLWYPGAQANTSRMLSSVSAKVEETMIRLQKLMLQTVALQRHLSAGSSEFLFTAWEPMITTIACAKPGSGNVEQALWEAANRPARPEGWASMPSPPWPVSHMEAHANTLGANGFTTRTAPTYSPKPRPSGQQQLNVSKSQICHRPHS